MGTRGFTNIFDSTVSSPGCGLILDVEMRGFSFYWPKWLSVEQQAAIVIIFVNN